MATMTHGIKLGTAVWKEGTAERRALVGQLPSDPSRVADLNRVERVRLAKLGEGRPEAVADALVPSSLRLLLESGPRAIQRAAQALNYADRWHKRSGLPENISPLPGACLSLPCLPRPLAIRDQDRFLDRLGIQGPMTALPAISGISVGIAASADIKCYGYCIAASSPLGPVLGAWLCFALGGEPRLQPEGQPRQPRANTAPLSRSEISLLPTQLHLGSLCGDLCVEIGGTKSKAPTGSWAGLSLPALRPAEVFILPAPMLRLPSNIHQGDRIVIEAPFDRLELSYGAEPLHPLVQ